MLPVCNNDGTLYYVREREREFQHGACYWQNELSLQPDSGYCKKAAVQGISNISTSSWTECTNTVPRLIRTIIISCLAGSFTISHHACAVDIHRQSLSGNHVKHKQINIQIKFTKIIRHKSAKVFTILKYISWQYPRRTAAILSSQSRQSLSPLLPQPCCKSRHIMQSPTSSYTEQEYCGTFRLINTPLLTRLRTPNISIGSRCANDRIQ